MSLSERYPNLLLVFCFSTTFPKILGGEYVGVERYFPVEFLIRYLESLSCRLHASPRWVFSTLLEIDIPITTIYPIYHSMFR